MKKITSVLLCMVLLLSMFSVNAAAAQTACMEAGVMVSDAGTVTVTVSAKQSAAKRPPDRGFRLRLPDL